MIVFIIITLTHHTNSSFQVVFSLGADDVFVMVDKWKNTRAIMPCASTTEVAIISLPR
jgi:quinol monooxygenase YgiN